MSKDEYYNSSEARLDTVLGDRAKYFTFLRKLKAEYDREPEPVPYIDFPQWALKRYGLQLVVDSDGRITAEHHIVDQSKYLMCVLKYGR